MFQFYTCIYYSEQFRTELMLQKIISIIISIQITLSYTQHKAIHSKTILLFILQLTAPSMQLCHHFFKKPPLLSVTCQSCIFKISLYGSIFLFKQNLQINKILNMFSSDLSSSYLHNICQFQDLPEINAIKSPFLCISGSQL